MAKRPKSDLIDDENPEWTAVDFKCAKRFDQLPPEMQQKLRAVRGAQKAPTKERITIRLSRDVVERFRASGTGWQTRIDAALREWLRRHPPGP